MYEEWCGAPSAEPSPDLRKFVAATFVLIANDGNRESPQRAVFFPPMDARKVSSRAEHRHR